MFSGRCFRSCCMAQEVGGRSDTGEFLRGLSAVSDGPSAAAGVQETCGRSQSGRWILNFSRMRGRRASNSARILQRRYRSTSFFQGWMLSGEVLSMCLASASAAPRWRPEASRSSTSSSSLLLSPGGSLAGAFLGDRWRLAFGARHRYDLPPGLAKADDHPLG